MKSGMILECQQDCYSRDPMLLILQNDQQFWTYPMGKAKQFIQKLMAEQRQFPLRINFNDSDMKGMTIRDIGNYPPRCTMKITEFHLCQPIKQCLLDQFQQTIAYFDKIERESNDVIRKQFTDKKEIELIPDREYITIEEALKLPERRKFKIIALIRKLLYTSPKNLSLEVQNGSIIIKMVCFGRKAEKVRAIMQEGKVFEFQDVMWKRDKNGDIELEFNGQIRRVDDREEKQQPVLDQSRIVSEIRSRIYSSGEVARLEKQRLFHQLYPQPIIESKMSMPMTVVSQAPSQAKMTAQPMPVVPQVSVVPASKVQAQPKNPVVSLSLPPSIPPLLQKSQKPNIIDHKTVKAYIQQNKPLKDFAVQGIVRNLKSNSNNRSLFLYDQENNFLHVTVWGQHKQTPINEQQRYLFDYMRFDRKNKYNNAISTNQHSIITPIEQKNKQQPIKLMNKLIKSVTEENKQRNSQMHNKSSDSFSELFEAMDKFDNEEQTAEHK